MAEQEQLLETVEPQDICHAIADAIDIISDAIPNQTMSTVGNVMAKVLDRLCDLLVDDKIPHDDTDIDIQIETSPQSDVDDITTIED